MLFEGHKSYFVPAPPPPPRGGPVSEALESAAETEVVEGRNEERDDVGRFGVELP